MFNSVSFASEAVAGNLRSKRMHRQSNKFGIENEDTKFLYHEKTDPEEVSGDGKQWYLYNLFPGHSRLVRGTIFERSRYRISDYPDITQIHIYPRDPSGSESDFTMNAKIALPTTRDSLSKVNNNGAGFMESRSEMNRKSYKTFTPAEVLGKAAYLDMMTNPIVSNTPKRKIDDSITTTNVQSSNVGTSNNHIETNKKRKILHRTPRYPEEHHGSSRSNVDVIESVEQVSASRGRDNEDRSYNIGLGLNSAEHTEMIDGVVRAYEESRPSERNQTHQTNATSVNSIESPNTNDVDDQQSISQTDESEEHTLSLDVSDRRAEIARLRLNNLLDNILTEDNQFSVTKIDDYSDGAIGDALLEIMYRIDTEGYPEVGEADAQTNMKRLLEGLYPSVEPRSDVILEKLFTADHSEIIELSKTHKDYFLYALSAIVLKEAREYLPRFPKAEAENVVKVIEEAFDLE